MTANHAGQGRALPRPAVLPRCAAYLHYRTHVLACQGCTDGECSRGAGDLDSRRLVLSRARSTCLLLRVDVAAQNAIHAGLIAGSAGLEPVDDLGVEAECELLFGEGQTDLDRVPIDLALFLEIDRSLELFLSELRETGE